MSSWDRICVCARSHFHSRLFCVFCCVPQLAKFCSMGSGIDASSLQLLHNRIADSDQLPSCIIHEFLPKIMFDLERILARLDTSDKNMDSFSTELKNDCKREINSLKSSLTVRMHEMEKVSETRFDNNDKRLSEIEVGMDKMRKINGGGKGLDPPSQFKRTFSSPKVLSMERVVVAVRRLDHLLLLRWLVIWGKSASRKTGCGDGSEFVASQPKSTSMIDAQ